MPGTAVPGEGGTTELEEHGKPHLDPPSIEAVADEDFECLPEASPLKMKQRSGLSPLLPAAESVARDGEIDEGESPAGDTNEDSGSRSPGYANTDGCDHKPAFIAGENACVAEAESEGESSGADEEGSKDTNPRQACSRRCTLSSEGGKSALNSSLGATAGAAECTLPPSVQQSGGILRRASHAPGRMSMPGRTPTAPVSSLVGRHDMLGSSLGADAFGHTLRTNEFFTIQSPPPAQSIARGFGGVYTNKKERTKLVDGEVVSKTVACKLLVPSLRQPAPIKMVVTNFRVVLKLRETLMPRTVSVPLSHIDRLAFPKYRGGDTPSAAPPHRLPKTRSYSISSPTESAPQFAPNFPNGTAPAHDANNGGTTAGGGKPGDPSSRRASRSRTPQPPSSNGRSRTPSPLPGLFLKAVQAYSAADPGTEASSTTSNGLEKPNGSETCLSGKALSPPAERQPFLSRFGSFRGSAPGTGDSPGHGTPGGGSAAADVLPLFQPEKDASSLSTDKVQSLRHSVRQEGLLDIHTKGVACYNICMSIEELISVRKVLSTLMQAHKDRNRKRFCTVHMEVHKAAGTQVEDEQNMGSVVAQEFERMTREISPESLRFKLSFFNQKYSEVPTYPELCIVPMAADENLFKHVAAFRTRGRFPVISWIHPDTGAAVSRSSQPKIGFGGKRSTHDELYLSLLGKPRAGEEPLPGGERADGAAASILAPSNTMSTTLFATLARDRAREKDVIWNNWNSMNPPSADIFSQPDHPNGETDDSGASKTLLVLDCRPFANAVANRSRMGGYEDERYYTNVVYENADLGNIHDITQSLKLLRKMAELPPVPANGAFAAAVQGTNWLKHLEKIIVTAIRVANVVDAGKDVLVHCSDGWDRTAQVTALAKLLLDPYYRTFEGFQVLIRHEWLALGHKLADRNGNVEGCLDHNEMSPIFLQWMDCVWQVWKQYPTQFEFSEQFLLYIVFHSTSGRFSTFLYNCEKERKEAGPVGVSFWAHLNSPSQRYHRPEFTNLLYTPSAATTMKPVNWPRILHYWEECHAQLDHDWTDLWSEPVSRKLMNLGRELEDHRVKRPKLEAALDAALKKRVDAGLDCYASTTRFTNLVKRPRDVPDMVRQLLEETVLTRLWDHIDHFSTRSRAPSFAASMLSLDMFRGHKAPSVMGPGGRWVPDSMAPCCAACLKPFQWFRRRHHCRVCGNVFCASHSRLRCVLAEHPSAGFVRVCSDCHAAVNRPGTRTASPAPQPTPSVSFG